jgi:hypothetical protein
MSKVKVGVTLMFTREIETEDYPDGLGLNDMTAIDLQADPAAFLEDAFDEGITHKTVRVQ